MEGQVVRLDRIIRETSLKIRRREPKGSAHAKALR